MPKRTLLAAILMTGTFLSGAAPATAAEVTSDRLINADKSHRTG
jgi:hypothetical protein